MGASGSGTRSHSKLTVEQTRRLDIRYLNRAGLLHSGRIHYITWVAYASCSDSVFFRIHDQHLSYCFVTVQNGQPTSSSRNELKLLYTPCNYGGYRYWFKCPKCDRRVAVLHAQGDCFYCRKCLNLAYQSQRSSYRDRCLTRRHKIGQKIFARYANGEGFGKRKGMHWKTFMENLEEYHRLDQEWMREIVDFIESRHW